MKRHAVLSSFLVVIIAVLIDQGVKFLVETRMGYGQQIDLLPFLALFRTHNEGIAFSMLAWLHDWGLVAITAAVILLCSISGGQTHLNVFLRATDLRLWLVVPLAISLIASCMVMWSTIFSSICRHGHSLFSIWLIPLSPLVQHLSFWKSFSVGDASGQRVSRFTDSFAPIRNA